MRHWKLLVAVLLVSQSVCCGVAQAAERPNVLWITLEDLSPILGCYGDPLANTPNCDALAAEGVRYTNAFASASVCTPARSCLITGVRACSMGTQHLRGAQPLAPQIRPFPLLLRKAGYYCTNNAKEDYNFPKPPGTWDESSGRAHWRKGPKDKPFFSVFNLMDSHQSRVRFPKERFDAIAERVGLVARTDPAKVPLPPYYPDTPVVRRDVARVYDMAAVVDRQAGEILDQLEADGLADDTIVFIFADHGTGIPRGKRYLHLSGTKVPLLIRFPKKFAHLAPVAPGKTVDRLVSFVDFAPTILSLLGVEIPEVVQGEPFLGPATTAPRDAVFATRDRVDEVYEFSRSVFDGRYQYIRNYYPYLPRLQFSWYSEQTATRKELRRLADAGKLSGNQGWLMRPSRAVEELYDTAADPHEVDNLIDSSQHAEIRERLKKELDAWMLRMRDTGLLPEAEMVARAQGHSPFVMARDSDRFDGQALLNAANLVGQGAEHLPRFDALAGSGDSGQRYWAMVGLTALLDQPGCGGDHGAVDTRNVASRLKDALDDESPSVRFAAAEGLCRLGQPELGLPLLVAGLDHPTPTTQLAAAIALVHVAESAGPVLPSVIKKRKSIDPRANQYALYVQWALEEVEMKAGPPRR